MEFVNTLFAFLIGLIASFYGSITGGAGMLSIPALIFIGIPADVAIATNKLGDLGRFSLSTYKFIKSGKVIWPLAVIFIPLSITGGILGASLLTIIDKNHLSKVIAIVILFLLPLIFFNKNLGIEQKESSQSKKLFGYIAYFFMNIYGSSIQLGSGPIIIYAITWFFGLNILQSNATSSFAWLFTTISSLCTLVFFDLIYFEIGIPLLIGSMTGGYLGTHIAINKGNRWTKGFFTIVIVLMGIKILVDVTFFR